MVEEAKDISDGYSWIDKVDVNSYKKKVIKGLWYNLMDVGLNFHRIKGQPIKRLESRLH